MNFGNSETYFAKDDIFGKFLLYLDYYHKRKKYMSQEQPINNENVEELTLLKRELTSLKNKEAELLGGTFTAEQINASEETRESAGEALRNVWEEIYDIEKNIKEIEREE